MAQPSDSSTYQTTDARSDASLLLKVRDLQVGYQTPSGLAHAVAGVSFDIHDGELVGIVGESGCGKSTLARALLNLIEHPGRIQDGTVQMRGYGDLLALGRRSRAIRRVRGAQISYVAQNPFSALNPILKIEDQFKNIMTAHRGRVSRTEAHDLALQMLDAVGIAGPARVLSGYAHELSGGMAQRVVIAMAFLLEPRLIIADEPTTGLDVTVQRQILDLIRTLLADSNRGMLLVTHDLGVVAQYCQRVMVMYAGKLVEDGLVSTVFRTPAHPYTAALLAAVPEPGHALVRLRGTVPNLVDYPVGCPFRERCDHAFEACHTMPRLERMPDGQRAACHLDEGVSAHVDHPS